MTPEKKESQMYFRMLMFLVLFTECEKWGLAMKGSVDKEMKMRLNNYLFAQGKLADACKKFVDPDVMEEFAERFSRVVEKLIESPVEKRDELLELIRAWASGEINIVE